MPGQFDARAIDANGVKAVSHRLAAKLFDLFRRRVGFQKRMIDESGEFVGSHWSGRLFGEQVTDHGTFFLQLIHGRIDF